MFAMPDGLTIITGASSGIGAATARLLGGRSVSLLLTARREAPLRGLVEEIRARGGRAELIAGDISDATTRQAIIDAAGRLGPVHAIVNNVGYGQLGPVELMSDEEAKRQFEVNLFAPMRLTSELLPAMRERRAGRIVNVSSVLGRVSIPLYGWYSATKHAMEALSDSMRAELRPFGIHISIVQPGPIRTEFGDVALKQGERILRESPKDYARHLASFEEIYRGERAEIGVDPLRVARAIAHAVTARRPRSVYRITAVTRALEVAAWLLPRSWTSALLARSFRLPRKMR